MVLTRDMLNKLKIDIDSVKKCCNREEFLIQICECAEWLVRKELQESTLWHASAIQRRNLQITLNTLFSLRTDIAFDLYDEDPCGLKRAERSQDKSEEEEAGNSAETKI